MRYILVVISLVSYLSLCAVSPFTNIRPLAERGLQCVGSQGDKESELALLQEAFIRGYDWLDTDNSADMKLMSDVVANIIVLRHELRGEDQQRLMLEIMLGSGVETINSNDFLYENMPNIYPQTPGNINVERSQLSSLLSEAVELMANGDLAQCESLLLALYNHSWIEAQDTNYRSAIANKLILYYLRLGLLDNAYNLCRQNKLEMDKAGIISSEYIENLVYKGFVLLLKEKDILGVCHLEVADELYRSKSLPNETVLKDYVYIMTGNHSQETSDSPDSAIMQFIKQNDRNFCFLTNNEREQSWHAVKDYWEDLKSKLVNNFGEITNIEDCLNAFQYEKQLMLRSMVRVTSGIRASGNPELIDLLDSLQIIKAKMATAFGDNWKQLKASHERIQKDLMQRAFSQSVIDNLYEPCSTAKILSTLMSDETFIDFGIITKDNTANYYAIVISHKYPKGKIVKLCKVANLSDFIRNNKTDRAIDFVTNLYHSDFLYSNLWRPLTQSAQLTERIYYCSAGGINSLMLDAIRHNDAYLGETYSFHILSSWANHSDALNGNHYMPTRICTFCDVDYYGDRYELVREAQRYGAARPIKKHFLDRDENIRTAFSISNSISPLSSRKNYEWLEHLGDNKGVELNWLFGIQAGEPAFKHLSGRYSGAINIATHAFSFPGDVEVMGQPYLMRQSLNLENTDRFTGVPNAMFRCGLLLSGAERVWCERNIIDDIDDGVLNGEEISTLDLTGVDLITLMACSTGEGDIDDYEGVYGIRRALKIAGCRSMITTAWNVDKEAAGAYMRVFYSNLLNGNGISSAHREAQLELIKRFEHPYYWSVFQLVD
ncbi:MAG: CHAT domain-containing protein [Muribaculum sp.]|nr:CHAT domain-containing protein [Muribaculum sp.]